MQSRDFVFWLQGFFELAPAGPISAEQAALIKAHLDLVFQHDTSIPRAEMTHPVPPAQPLQQWFPNGYPPNTGGGTGINPQTATAIC